MIVPKWIFLVCFVFSLLIMVARIANSLHEVTAKNNIFGADKHQHKVGMVSNLGYAVVSFLLGIYFILFYFDSMLATPVFVVMLILLLMVLIVDATFKKRA